MMIGTLRIDEIPLLDKNITSYTGITTDYKNIYMVSSKESVIVVYDFYFNFIKYITITNSYYDICYDSVELCFWAVSNSNKIYKLDYTNFCEIDSINVSVHRKLSNIAFDNKNNTLIVAFNNFTIATYNKKGQLISEELLGGNECICGLTNICDISLVTSLFSNSNVFLIKLLDSNFVDENISCLPKNYMAKSMCSYSNDDENYIFILAQKHNKYAYIIQYKLIYFPS